MMKRHVSQIGVGTILEGGWEVRWVRIRPNQYVEMGILRDGIFDRRFVPQGDKLEVES